MRNTTAVIAPVALIALLLSGCSAAGSAEKSTAPSSTATSPATDGATADGSDASAQTAAEACDIMRGGVQSLSAMNSPENLATLQSDPAAAVGLMTTAEGDLSAAVDQVTNAEIAPIASTALADTTAYFDIVKKMAAAPTSIDLPAFNGALTTFTASMTSLQQACTS